MPHISVIVPVYRVENYLHRCVDSILSQTFSDFELILVNDGSPDRCPEICDSYAMSDPRVRVIHQTNQGQASARNHGVREAQGQWVCFIDSDDLVHPQMLEHLYQAASSCEADISMCGAVEDVSLPDDFQAPKELVFTKMPINEAGFEECYAHGEHRYWVIWGKLIRREILASIPFEAGRIFEDNAVVCRWLYEAKVVADIPHRYYFYQINPDGTTKSQFRLKHLDFLWALEEQLRFYQNIGYANMEKIIAAYFLQTTAWYSSRVHHELNNIPEAEKIRRRMRRVMQRHPLDSLSLTVEQMRSIRWSLHPMLAQALRLPRVICNELSHGGLPSLLRRIARKFKKYD